MVQGILFHPGELTVIQRRKSLMKIAVAGTGYVGLSLAVLLNQHNEVVTVDILQEKVEKINNWQSSHTEA